MDLSLRKVREMEKDREAWRAASPCSRRVRYNLMTEQQPFIFNWRIIYNVVLVSAIHQM